MILSAANHSTAMKENSNSKNSSSIRISLLEGNNISGSMQEHYRLMMIKDDVVDVQFFLNPEFTRANPLDLTKALQGTKPVIDCGRGKPSTTCLPDPQNSKISENCRGLLYLPRNRAC
ncbi:hypothetical protein OWV82_020820 [Melia azedarach]|uniref:Uncharacterized protein n=1 Tax=Melia azedarach TaxID=155640 RepID=A0ACC1X7V2_MELAZ|nr:hypothetical protein OWV82_020820 [Melia azedarach]